MTTATETTATETVQTETETPSRKAQRRALKAAAKLEKKQAKAARKAWKKARPKKEPWVSPILWVKDVRGYATWCEKAFGFEIAGISGMPGGRAFGALKHRRGTIMIGEAEDPSTMGPPAGKVSVTVYVYTADVDALAQRALAAGAKMIVPVGDQHWGDRCAGFMDIEGHSWMFAKHLGKCSSEHGDQPPVDACSAPDARHASA